MKKPLTESLCLIKTETEFPEEVHRFLLLTNSKSLVKLAVSSGSFLETNRILFFVKLISDILTHIRVGKLINFERRLRQDCRLTQ